MFKTKNLVRMHDIDMVGILYFPRQFRFVHEALEDFMEGEGFGFNKLFTNKEFLFVIVHCEADYLATLRLGDRLEIDMFVENIGNTSFTFHYDIYKGKEREKTGTAKTVHVCLDAKNRKKIPIPSHMREILTKHLS